MAGLRRRRSDAEASGGDGHRWVVLTGVLLLLGAATPHGLEAQAPAEGGEEAVLQVVQGLFDAMAARNPDAARELLLADGYFTSHRQENGERVISTVSHQEFLESMATWDEAPLERIWEPDVVIRGGVAMAWTPYDFWWGGEFSHCGVNVFSLVETPEGWKIASIVYTVERTGCEPSPLGPPTSSPDRR